MKTFQFDFALKDLICEPLIFWNHHVLRLYAVYCIIYVHNVYTYKFTLISGKTLWLLELIMPFAKQMSESSYCDVKLRRYH